MSAERDPATRAAVAMLVIAAGLAVAHLLWESKVGEDGIAAFVVGGPLALGVVGGSMWLGARTAIGEGRALALALLLAFLWWWAMGNAPELAEFYRVSRSTVVGATGLMTLTIAAGLVVAGIRARLAAASPPTPPSLQAPE